MVHTNATRADSGPATGTLRELLEQQQKLAASEARARRQLESLDADYAQPPDQAAYHQALTRWRTIAQELERINHQIGAHYARN